MNNPPKPFPGPTPQELLPKLRDLQKSPLDFLVNFTQQYGPIARIPVPGMNVFNLADPDAIKHVLLDNAKNYSKKTLQYTNLALVTGQGLLTSDGDFWLRQRRLSQPAFHRDRLAGFAATMIEASNDLVRDWNSKIGQAVDIDHAMMQLSLQIVGQTLFSVDMKDDSSALVKATLEALDFVIFKAKNPFSAPVFVPTGRNLNFKKAVKVLDSAIDQIIESRKSAPAKDDLLQMLLEARTEDGEAMSARQLRDEIITIIIAGHETVASALTWTFYLLAEHPAKEKLLRAELDRVLEGRAVTPSDLTNLPYTRAVFDEALRLYPPAWVITRKALNDDEIAGYRVPKGSLLVMCPYIAHRQEIVWEAPLEFRPERFLAEAKTPRFAYIPFGGGPRLCIGNNFALMEGVAILANVLQNFSLESLPGSEVEEDALVTIRPKGGLELRLARPS